MIPEIITPGVYKIELFFINLLVWITTVSGCSLIKKVTNYYSNSIYNVPCNYV